MQIKQLDGDLWDIVNGDKKARIELGPRRLTAKATKELLSDENTASHYFAGEKDNPDNPDGQKIVGRDANGKPIKVGEEMTYIDWKNRKSDPVWYVYLFDGVRFQPQGEAETYDAALSAATTLVA